MMLKKLTSADRRLPRLRFRKKNGILNKAAMCLLIQDGETHVTITRNAAGEICLKPFMVEGLIGIVRVHNLLGQSDQGPSRMALGCLAGELPEGDYELIWNDVEGVAVMQPMKKGQETQ